MGLYTEAVTLEEKVVDSVFFYNIILKFQSNFKIK